MSSYVHKVVDAEELFYERVVARVIDKKNLKYLDDHFTNWVIGDKLEKCSLSFLVNDSSAEQMYDLLVELMKAENWHPSLTKLWEEFVDKKFEDLCSNCIDDFIQQEFETAEEAKFEAEVDSKLQSL